MFGIEEALDFGRYTMEARRAVSHAMQSVQRSRGAVITPEHLVLGLLQEDVRASQYVRASGIDPQGLQKRISQNMPRHQTTQPQATLPLADETKAILRSAYREAQSSGRKMTSIDMLISVLKQEGTTPAKVLAEAGLSAERLRNAFEADQERVHWMAE